VEAAPLFTTAQAATIERGTGKTEITIMAHHCELVEAELAGKGTGLAGFSVTAATSANRRAAERWAGTSWLGVESIANELDARAPRGSI